MWFPNNKYTNPPVVEAVIDLRVSNSGEVPQEALATFASANEGYPECEPLTEGNAVFVLGDEPSVNIDDKATGFNFRSTSRHRLLTVLPHRFSIHEFAPYGGWDNFSQEALRLWRRYGKQFPGRPLTRIAVRYINKIEIEIDRPMRMEDYFHTYPAVSDDITEPMNSFFMRAGYTFPEQRVAGSITQATIQASRPGVAAILLDIDVWRDHQFDIGATSDEELPEALEELRRVKNSLFEGCITNRLREMIS
ncbi:TIGR04255 family protein [Micromonospora sp. NPDC047730]|uniref:TIGR04255 family protein n=1 Tax=Micromonospora sp. NPDC047730 TaxID=3364253 RepID=UPI00372413DB